MSRPGLFLAAVIIIIFVLTFTVANMAGKTLWDVLELLIIPLVLALGAIFFSWSQMNYELRIAEQVRQTDREIAADSQREATLQNYLDKMADLLLKEHLLERKDNKDDPVLDVAKVRTVTAVRSLDKDRRNIVFQFLRDAKLIDFILVNAPLGEADLSGANLYKANLSEAIFFKTNLSEAELSEADLSQALIAYTNLSKAQLGKANLSGANIYMANLREANLGGAILSDAELVDTDMRRVGLVDANLSGANLNGSNLEGSYLIHANLSKATLRNVNLDWANLTKAKVTKKQLAQAKSLRHATMPDGTVHK
jgi:energy-coupling factor transporter transmembrane protein EcfT